MADPGAPLRPAARWQLRSLLAQPWRLGFAAGGSLLVVAGAWWVVVLLPGVPVPWAVPRGLAHGAVMALGPFPLFIGGFAVTALPRWLVAAHTARPLALGLRPGWLFAAVQAAAVLRSATSALSGSFLLLPAALLWAASLGTWASRIAREAGLAAAPRAQH